MSDSKIASLTAYITVSDGPAAIDFYQRAFGAIEKFRMAGENSKPDRERLGHAEVDFGGFTLMLSDEYPKYGAVSATTLRGSNVAFVLDVADVETAFERAVAAGARIDRPISEAPYGRGGWVVDPFGIRWNVFTSNPDFDPESMKG